VKKSWTKWSCIKPRNIATVHNPPPPHHLALIDHFCISTKGTVSSDFPDFIIHILHSFALKLQICQGIHTGSWFDLTVHPPPPINLHNAPLPLHSGGRSPENFLVSKPKRPASFVRFPWYIPPPPPWGVIAILFESMWLSLKGKSI
jgi:hypothetical protein